MFLTEWAVGSRVWIKAIRYLGIKYNIIVANLIGKMTLVTYMQEVDSGVQRFRWMPCGLLFFNNNWGFGKLIARNIYFYLVMGLSSTLELTGVSYNWPIIFPFLTPSLGDFSRVASLFHGPAFMYPYLPPGLLGFTQAGHLPTFPCTVILCQLLSLMSQWQLIVEFVDSSEPFIS